MRHSSIGTRKTVNSLAEASPATQPPHSHTKTATGRLSTAQTNRRLNFESRENRSSTLRSVETGRNYQHSPLVNGASSANTTRRNVFSLSPSKSPRRNLHEELQNGIDENEGQNDQPMQLYDGAMGDTEIDDAPPLPPIYDDSGGYDESQADPGVPDDMGPDDEPDDQLQGEPDDASGVHDRRKSRRRQTRSSDVQDEPTVQSIEDEQLEDEQLEDGQSQEDQVEDEQSQDDQIAEDDEPSDAAGEPPGSDRATSRKTKKGQKASKTKQTREPKKALSRKDPIASRSTANQQRPRNGFKKPGSLQRERHQTPNNEDEDSSILHTRSGRTSYRPLQYWKGERAVYRPQYEELSTIKEIVRMDDVTPVKRQPSRSTSANPPKRKKRKLPVYADNADEEDEELEEDGLEDWEKEEAEGVVSGHVRVWDVDMQSGVEERREQGEMFHFFFIHLLSFQIVSSELSTCHPHMFLPMLTCTNDRTSFCIKQNRSTRRRRSQFPLRENAIHAILRLRDGRASPRWVQATEELAQNADGLLRALWKGQSCRVRQRVCDQQRWSVAGAQRYVSAFLSQRSGQRLCPVSPVFVSDLCVLA